MDVGFCIFVGLIVHGILVMRGCTAISGAISVGRQTHMTPPETRERNDAGT